MLDVLERKAGPLPVGAWAIIGVLGVAAATGHVFKGRAGGKDTMDQDPNPAGPFTFTSAVPDRVGLSAGSFMQLRKPRRTDLTDVGRNTYTGADVNDMGDLLTRISQRNGGRAAVLVPMAAQLQPGPIGWVPYVQGPMGAR